jgi:hypothetical protein
MSQLIHRGEEFGGACLSTNASNSSMRACRVAKRITLPMDLALYLRRSEADSSIFSLQKSDHYHELKNPEADDG